MKIDLDGLKSLFQEHGSAEPSQTRGPCPEPEKIVALLRSQLPRRKAEKIIDHIFGCSRCGQEFRFLLGVFREEKILIQEIERWLTDRSLSSEAKNVSPPAGKGRKGWPFVRSWSWRTASVVAAGLIMAVLIFSLLVLRHVEEFRTDFLARVELIEPMGEEIPRASLVFHWKSLRRAESYAVSIYDDNLNLVWKSVRIPDTRLILPAEVTFALVEGKRYFWMVTAFSDGREIGSSVKKFILKR